MMPLAVETDGSATISFFPHTTSGHVEWVHVTNPDQWQMIPWTPHVTSGNRLALLHDSSGPVPIVKACLLDPFIYKLVHDDYLRLAKHYGILQYNKHSNEKDIVKAIANHISNGDDAWVASVMENYEESKRRLEEADSLELMCEDPFFEAAFEELSKDDQLEFHDIKDTLAALNKKRAFSHARVKAIQKKRQAQAEGVEPRPKRRRLGLRRSRVNAKAKAKANSAPAVPILEDVPPEGIVALESPVAAHPLPAASSDNPAPLPGVPVAEPMQHHAQPAAAVRAAAADRSARQQPWGPFMLALACPRQIPSAWTATCTLHQVGGRCNKNLSFANGSMTADEARCRIKNCVWLVGT